MCGTKRASVCARAHRKEIVGKKWRKKIGNVIPQMDIKETTHFCSRQGFTLHFGSALATHVFKRRREKKKHDFVFRQHYAKIAPASCDHVFEHRFSIYLCLCRKSLYLFIGFSVSDTHTQWETYFYRWFNNARNAMRRQKFESNKKKNNLLLCFLCAGHSMSNMNRVGCVFARRRKWQQT